jgi:hypothetical protein
MLRSLKELQGYKALSLDGPIGNVHDFYLDDRIWGIRYLVVDLGGWLPGRKVLISPAALSQPDWEVQMFPLKLTKKEIESSPSIDIDKPISRQRQAELHRHYQWPMYWHASGMPVAGGVIAQPDVAAEKEDEHTEEQGDPRLRSTREVLGYHIQASDGEIGHVEDFIVEDTNWAINYIAVDTRNWLPGRKVLISPQWIEQIKWLERSVYIDLSQETIRNSPEYDPSTPVNREYEARLYDYYGRPKD